MLKKINKSYAYIDASYLALLTYVDKLWSSSRNDTGSLKYSSGQENTENSIGSYFIVTEYLGLVYTPIAGLGLIHHNFWKNISPSEPIMWWPKLKQFVLDNEPCLQQNNTFVSDLITIVKVPSKVDGRLLTIYRFMYDLLLDYVEEFSALMPLDYVIERIPEIELQIHFKPTDELSLRFFHNGVGGQLSWTEVSELLNKREVKVLLLTSPYELSRLVGRSHDSN